MRLWVIADSETRSVLTEIANWVDSSLTVDPDKKGQEWRELSVRVLAVPIGPARVSVAYQVLPEDCQVRVVRLMFFR